MQECEALEEFPSRLRNLVTLNKLCFSGYNSIIRDSKEFATCVTQEATNVSNVKHRRSFPLGLSNYLALEELTIGKRKSLKNILGGFGSLTCLKNLYMWKCEVLVEFPPGLRNLLALEESYGCKSLRNVPKGFGSFTCLKKPLMMNCQDLEEFPSGLTNL